MKINNEYKELTNDILSNTNFVLLQNDVHHGTNKLAHCKRVSFLSFLLSKIFKGNAKNAARGGLLHDFFYGSRTAKEENNYLKHPQTSANNAKKYFDISTEELNIIKSHMYHHALLKRLLPFIKEEDKRYLAENKPKSKDAVIVCISDLLVSIFEVCAFKIRYSVCLYMIFFMNVIRY